MKWFYKNSTLKSYGHYYFRSYATHEEIYTPTSCDTSCTRYRISTLPPLYDLKVIRSPQRLEIVNTIAKISKLS